MATRGIWGDSLPLCLQHRQLGALNIYLDCVRGLLKNELTLTARVLFRVGFMAFFVITFELTEHLQNIKIPTNRRTIGRRVVYLVDGEVLLNNSCILENRIKSMDEAFRVRPNLPAEQWSVPGVSRTQSSSYRNPVILSRSMSISNHPMGTERLLVNGSASASCSEMMELCGVSYQV